MSIMATEPTAPDECKRCRRETRDAAYFCDDCGDELARELGEVPWLTEQLDISVTRQQSSDAYHRAPSALAGDLVDQLAGMLETGLKHVPVPWHETASRAQRSLHSVLAMWVKFCVEQRVRHQSASDGLPADDMPAMSRWLMWRVDGLALHERGGDAVDAIVSATNEARRIVLWKPKRRLYLAVCEVPVEGVKCPGDVYAEEDADHGNCDNCNAIHEVAARRIALNKRLDDHLCTGADIARMSVFLGLQAKRETVRLRVKSWHSRGRIISHATSPGGDPMYRYGEVKGMLDAAFGERTKTGS